MYIKYVCLEGFLSFTEETWIGPFDEHTNGITGGSGTGKSAILDGICFVLGMTPRATYEAEEPDFLISDIDVMGRVVRAPMAKASIILDNTDKTPGRCPIGYESCDSIVVTRTVELEEKDGQKNIISKYHMNGKWTQKCVVADFFASNRIDVNNPNFMITQEKLDEVKDMKPKELLKLIKGAVGATACEEVNTEFDSLVNTFLPNVHAKLVPKNPNNVAAGLQIHVCERGLWTTGLQRIGGTGSSLVALSLLLALCQHNSVPFCLLDELAFLDWMSSEFDVGDRASQIRIRVAAKLPQTQFICASRHDGMYKNANKIFTTYYEDGRSKVKAAE